MSIIYSILAAVVIPVGADGPKPADLTAQDMLDRMATAYAGCKSYIDSGVVETVFDVPDGKQQTEVKPFTTAFVRPDQFRFEFTMKGGGDQKAGARVLRLSTLNPSEGASHEVVRSHRPGGFARVVLPSHPRSRPDRLPRRPGAHAG